MPDYSIAPAHLLSLFEQGSDRDLPGFVPVDHSYPLLNLGAGNKTVNGTLPLDWPEYDFEDADLPFNDGEVGGILAYHVLEHLRDPRPLLRECSRVLAFGAPMNIVVPHYMGTIAFQDLDHKTFWTSETFRTLLDNPYYSKDHDGFSFEIGANVIMGLNERNLMLVTQLIKV